MKLALPSVTMVCADCVETQRVITVLEKCKGLCDFGDVKYFTSLETDYPHVKIKQLVGLNGYSAWMLKHLHEYISTPHLLTVQWDGWILNPDVWRPHWLGYDYIGPLFLQERDINADTVGSGGFSFRSKALMAAVSGLLPEWNGSNSYWGADGQNNWGHEDGVVTKHLRVPLTSKFGFRYAPPHEAAVFAQGGNPDARYFVERPFGFHGWWKNIDRENGTVYKLEVPWS
jgi:Protein of unknown function (DUF5672)